MICSSYHLYASVSLDSLSRATPCLAFACAAGRRVSVCDEASLRYSLSSLDRQGWQRKVPRGEWQLGQVEVELMVTVLEAVPDADRGDPIPFDVHI